jgi:hypothetical protein
MSPEESGGDGAPEPDDVPGGPPPNPLDRPWVQLFGGSMGYGGRRLNRLKNLFAGKVFLSAFELAMRVSGTRPGDDRPL